MGFLTGKTAIITGAGRAVLKDGSCGSIGYGIATAYAKEGANLVITGRNVKKLEAAKQELESLYGIKVLTVQADVCAGGDNEATVANVVKQAVDTFGGIQVLINNAQASASGVPLAERELIFQPFYRALGSEADGSGLGLPIVMEIARQHGAQVLLQEARPGHTPQGALFTVRFKAMPGQQ